MKTVRLFTFLIVAMLVFSAWTPSPVLAKPDAAAVTIGANSVSVSMDFATAKPVKLVIGNSTGGIIYITLTGTRSYYFVASKPGKNTFMIDKGVYTATIRVSTCKGTLTKKHFSGGSLGTIVCR